jgi:hypothetical protein
MINEIINKVSNLDYSRKSDNKRNDREAPAKSELENRSDLMQHDTIEISGQKPVEASVEKVIAPVSGQDKDVHLLSDVYHTETARGNEDTNITPKGNDYKPVVEEKSDVLKGISDEEEISLHDSLASAYGTKETEVGKVIRMTA